MTVPGKGEPANPSQNEMPSRVPPPAAQAQPAAASQKEPVRDLIPLWLVVAIFALVMVVTTFMLAENWMTEMTRYRSIKAQQKGNWTEAEKQLKKLIAEGEKQGNAQVQFSPTYLSELGYSYYNQGNYDEALKYYEQAQKYGSNFPPDDQGNPRPPADFQNMLGLVQYKKGNIDVAEKYLLGALQNNKLDPLANYTLGQIAMDRGNYIKAADYFKVVADNPHYASEVKKHYAEIEQKLFAGIE